MTGVGRLVCAVVAGAGLLTACSGGSNARSAHDSTASSHGVHIVYRVEDHTRPPIRVTTQVVDVAPPFAAKVVTLAGPPPGGSSLGGAAWDARHDYLIDPDGAIRVIQEAAARFAPPDAHLDVALPVAARLGWVQPGGSTTVNGMRCRQWTSRDPLDSGPIRPATATDRTVSCVDDAGHIVMDRWTLHDRLARTRVATRLESRSPLSAEQLIGSVTPTPIATDVAATAVKPEPVRGLSRAIGVPLPTAPPGTSLVRSDAVIGLDRTTGNPSITDEGAVFAWTGSGHLVVLTMKRALTREVALSRRGQKVRLDAGVARLSPVLTGLQLTLTSRAGLAVTITSDLAAAQLLAWAETLHIP